MFEAGLSVLSWDDGCELIIGDAVFLLFLRFKFLYQLKTYNSQLLTDNL